MKFQYRLPLFELETQWGCGHRDRDRDVTVTVTVTWLSCHAR